MLDRPRHKKIIEELLSLNVKLKLPYGASGKCITDRCERVGQQGVWDVFKIPDKNVEWLQSCSKCFLGSSSHITK